MKISEKANDLIGEFSRAVERTALSPSESMFRLYCATREDLEDYIGELEEGRIGIEYLSEDELPENIPDEIYAAMFDCSKVDFVRLFPYITLDGHRLFLINLLEERNEL